MGYLARTTTGVNDDIMPFLEWMTHLEGERPRVPEQLEPTAHRIVAELLSLVAGIDQRARAAPRRRLKWGAPRTGHRCLAAGARARGCSPVCSARVAGPGRRRPARDTTPRPW